MIELTEELIQKHRKIVEAAVKAHTSHSKTGKTFQVMQHDREVPHQVRFASLKSLRTMSKGGQFADHAKTELARRKVEGGFASTKAKHLDKKARMARAIKRDAAAEKTRARFRRGPASNAGEWS